MVSRRLVSGAGMLGCRRFLHGQNASTNLFHNMFLSAMASAGRFSGPNTSASILSSPRRNRGFLNASNILLDALIVISVFGESPSILYSVFSLFVLRLMLILVLPDSATVPSILCSIFCFCPHLPSCSAVLPALDPGQSPAPG